MKCSSKPESIEFKLAKKECRDSRNSQVGRTRTLRRRLDHNQRQLGKGGRSKKSNGRCSASCSEKCPIESLDLNTAKVTFYEKTRYGRELVGSSTGKTIKFHPFEMPDCLEVEISDAVGKKYQVLSLDVTCGASAELSVNDSFGALTIEDFDSC